jgi:hypothetical protein
VDREPSSWKLIRSILANHIKPGHDCAQTINRLWTKNVTEHRPPIAEVGASVYLEEWPLARLWSLIPETDVTEMTPHLTHDPPIVVRWKGRDYRIDGRRRINQLKREGAEGPHSVVILDIGDV